MEKQKVYVVNVLAIEDKDNIGFSQKVFNDKIKAQEYFEQTIKKIEQMYKEEYSKEKIIKKKSNTYFCIYFEDYTHNTTIILNEKEVN